VRWLIDEGIPKSVVNWLCERGDNVFDVAQSDYRGEPDEALWRLAGRERRVVVTRDLGFLWPSLSPAPTGVVLIRAPDGWQARQILVLIQDGLRRMDAGSLDGNVTVIQPGSVRQRPLAEISGP